MNCQEIQRALSAFVDGEATTQEQRAIEAHLGECADCGARMESLRAVKHAVARLPDNGAVPGAVRARIEALRLHAPRRRLRAFALVAVAAMMLAFAGVALQHLDRGRQLADDLVADHLDSVPEVKPAQVSSSDPAEVARFFAGKTPFPAVAPQLPGTSLLGGRLCRIRGRLYELLFYQADGQTLSLFVSDPSVGATDCRESHGHAVCGRRSGDVALLLVGRLPGERLKQILDDAAL